MTFIQARNYTPAKEGRAISLLVLHTMEAPEKPGTALAVARWFAGPTAPRASAHYCVDSEETVQCVAEQDVAWAAPGANSVGIQIEHAGYAKQTVLGWTDEYSTKMLLLSAKLAAGICYRHNIPVVKLTASDLIAKKRGICGHSDVSQAFKKSTHTDPGKDFPWPQYLALVTLHLAAMEGRT